MNNKSCHQPTENCDECQTFVCPICENRFRVDQAAKESKEGSTPYFCQECYSAEE